MMLISMTIELERWGANKGQYTGSAMFSGDAGSVTLNLNKHHIEQIFQVCADGIIDTAKAAARHLTVSVIEHQKGIESAGGE